VENSDGPVVFIPRDFLARVLDLDNVLIELMSHVFGQQTRMSKVLQAAKFIIHKATKLFAILALIEKMNELGHILNAKIDDGYLPLERCKEHQSWGLRSYSSAEGPLSGFKGWRRSSLSAFESYQWQVLSPVFTLSDQPYEYDLRREVILPFLNPSDNPNQNLPSTVDAGILQTVRIHPAHHYFPQTVSLAGLPS
jgi:hypothetical protein